MLILWVLGCSGNPTTIEAEEPTLDASFDDDSGGRESKDIQKILFSGLPESLYETTFKILLQLTDPITGQVSAFTFEPDTPEMAFELNLANNNLPSTLRAYVDLNQTGLIETCGYPAHNGQVVNDDNLDLWSGSLEIEYQQNAPFDVPMFRQSCGPGTDSTIWRTEIDLVEVPQNETSKLYVELISIHEENSPAFRTLISVPTDIRNDDGISAIRLGNLLPGQHRARLFLDTDHNLEFSPCEPSQISGGDRIFSDAIQFEIADGETFQSSTVMKPIDSGCLEESRTITGIIDASVLENKTARQTNGRLVLKITDANSGARLYARELSRSNVTRTSFSVTNLPNQPLVLRLFLDRDGDGALNACSDVINGQDLFSTSNIDIELSDNEKRDLGVLTLEMHECPIERLSNFQTQLIMEPPGSRKESPRPVYGIITNQITGESLLRTATQDHTSIADNTILSTTLPPGEYTFYAFVDSEQDARFTHCEFDAFGDRAVTDLVSFSLSDYELFAAQAVRLERLGCNFPNVQLNLNVNVDSLSTNLTQMNVVIALKESGGLEEKFVFDVPPVSPPWFFPINDLVPGTYELSVHLDQNMDQTLDECDEAFGGELVAQSNFTLDRSTPILEADLVLADQCLTLNNEEQN